MIIAVLREVEVFLHEEETSEHGVWAISVIEKPYYRWRKEADGLQIDQAKQSITW